MIRKQANPPVDLRPGQQLGTSHHGQRYRTLSALGICRPAPFQLAPAVYDESGRHHTIGLLRFELLLPDLILQCPPHTGTAVGGSRYCLRPSQRFTQRTHADYRYQQKAVHEADGVVAEIRMPAKKWKLSFATACPTVSGHSSCNRIR